MSKFLKHLIILMTLNCIHAWNEIKTKQAITDKR